MNHFWSNPWFISMLNTENLLGGDTIRQIDDLADVQSVLLSRVREIMERGLKDDIFKREIDPKELYVLIASVCWFPISNMHTLRVVFQLPIDEGWLNAHAEKAADMIVSYLCHSDTPAPIPV